MQTSPTTTTTNVCTTTETVAGCRGKRLQTFANVCTTTKNSRRLQGQTFANVCKRCGSRNGRPAWASGPGTARPRGAWAGLRNGRACGRGPGAAFTAWPDRHPLARTARRAEVRCARLYMDACRSGAGGVGLGQAPRACRAAGITWGCEPPPPKPT